MRTFPNPAVTKAAFLAIMQEHAKQDRIVKGKYWENGKGCDIGCGVETINHLLGIHEDHKGHNVVADTLGIPLALAHLENRIFNGLIPAKAMSWPIRFAEAIPENADLTPSVNRILVRVLREVALPAVTVDEWGVKAAIKKVCLALETGEGLRTAAVAADCSSRSVDLIDGIPDSSSVSAFSAVRTAFNFAYALANTSNFTNTRVAFTLSFGVLIVVRAASGGINITARNIAYEKIADIIIKEMQRCAA